jgi:hypothetical protein
VLNDYRARNGALEKRVQQLEYILAQRIVNTENKFKALESRFDAQEKQVLQVFRDNPGIGFTYDAFIEEYHVHYPNAPIANVDRRIRNLFAGGNLWRDVDPETKKTRYYLKLEIG